ncbi:MAG: hypothetical protein DRN53_01900 [Thermoprotei archaeon]|nr:MAG: hypothetical protein DRN53_01900 [Thermoprotei archaeon]
MRSMKYRVLIGERIRRAKLKDILQVIEAIQSYEGEWGLVVAPARVMYTESIEEIPPSEKLTSIPTTHGSLLVHEIYLDEEELLKRLELEEVDILAKGLEAGLPLSSILGDKRAQKVIDEFKDVIAEEYIEVLIPTTSEIEYGVQDFDIDGLEEVEIFSCTIPIVGVDMVDRLLEMCEYVEEYLERLENLIREESKLVDGYMVALRCFRNADTTLMDLEEEVQEAIDLIGEDVIEGVVMVNRILESP